MSIFVQLTIKIMCESTEQSIASEENVQALPHNESVDTGSSVKVEAQKQLDEELCSTELCDYYKGIEHLAETESSDLFRNSGDAHAVVVFHHIFKNSKSVVRILAKDLCNRVTSSKLYRDALISFLSTRGSELQILLNAELNLREKLESDTIFRYLLPYRSQIKIRQTSKKLKRGKVEDIHMCIGDNKMYRIETDIIGRKAEGCFNDCEYVAHLINVFDSLFNDKTTKDINFL